MWSDSCSSCFTHLTLLNYKGNTLTGYHFPNKTISIGNSTLALYTMYGIFNGIVTVNNGQFIEQCVRKNYWQE